MTPLVLPALHQAAWPGIYVDQFDHAGCRVWSVQFVPASRKRRRTWRRWIGDEATALAFAADTAERLDVPLFDLRSEGAEG
jgi:hypothetical protein